MVIFYEYVRQFWNGITVVNNDDLTMFVRNKTVSVVKEEGLWDMEVVSFGFYDDELCVRVK